MRRFRSPTLLPARWLSARRQALGLGSAALLAAAPLLGGCTKKVDPAYLEALELAASAECKCNAEPERIGDCDNPYPRHPPAPKGQPFLQYEASLDGESKEKIEAARGKLERCVAVRSQASAFKDVVDKRQEQLLHPEQE